MFKSGISMHTFVRLFSVRNAEVVSNKKARFVAFCKKAKTKSLFERPNYISTWVAWLCVMPAILNRLQSSYADCRFEFGVILEWFRESMGTGLSSLLAMASPLAGATI